MDVIIVDSLTTLAGDEVTVQDLKVLIRHAGAKLAVVSEEDGLRADLQSNI